MREATQVAAINAIIEQTSHSFFNVSDFLKSYKIDRYYS